MSILCGLPATLCLAATAAVQCKGPLTGTLPIKYGRGLTLSLKGKAMSTGEVADILLTLATAEPQVIWESAPQELSCSFTMTDASPAEPAGETTGRRYGLTLRGAHHYLARHTRLPS